MRADLLKGVEQGVALSPVITKVRITVSSVA